MYYRDFSLSKVKRDFNLTTVENGRFLPEMQPIEPSLYFKEALSEGLLYLLIVLVILSIEVFQKLFSIILFLC